MTCIPAQDMVYTNTAFVTEATFTTILADASIVDIAKEKAARAFGVPMVLKGHVFNFKPSPTCSNDNEAYFSALHRRAAGLAKYEIVALRPLPDAGLATAQASSVQLELSFFNKRPAANVSVDGEELRRNALDTFNKQYVATQR